jgi:hypothetical protein
MAKTVCIRINKLWYDMFLFIVGLIIFMAGFLVGRWTL